MTIKQQGGIFGRNPTFNNVDVDGSLDVTGSTSINSGDLLVGKTASNFATDGIEARSTGQLYVTDTSATPLVVRRNTSDGEITSFYKDGTAVASIGTAGGNSIYINGNTSSVATLQFGGGSLFYPSVDNVADIGANTRRFKSIYLSGGVYVGGTVAANLFDDYEEGLHTPTITPQTSGTLTFNTANDSMYYAKIGRQVFVGGSLRINVSSSPVGTYVDITLPFTVAALTDSAAFSTTFIDVLGSPALTLTQPSTSVMRVYVDASTLVGGTYINFSINYPAA